jgi:hypothetical protein
MYPKLAMHQIGLEFLASLCICFQLVRPIPKISHTCPTTRNAFTSRAQYLLQDFDRWTAKWDFYTALLDTSGDFLANN